MTQFTDLGLAKPLLQALAAEGYDKPTPIQAQAIPGVMAGRDLLGIAQTGTGKTAAFALPILHRLQANPKRAPRRGCRVLVLSPTRELASQIGDSFRTYGARMGVSVAVVFGGVKAGAQIRAMENGVDVLVATPGRLLDHMGTKHIQLDWTEILVLDEADQMLDLGFVVPIRKIVARIPKERQNLFFSATMPSEIGKLAGELLKDPLKVQVTPVATTAERVNQKVLFVEADKKRELLAELIEDGNWSRTIVFTRTKRGADRVAKFLVAAKIEAASIHGDKSQAQRERALAEFKTGKVRVLVATDIAARGIDIDAVSHVVNYEMPNVPEAYVHRIGRTARAGAEGSAVSLCSDDERPLLRDIQRLTRLDIDSQDRRRDPALAIAAKAYAAAGVEPAKVDRPHGQKDGQQRGGRGRQGQQRQGPGPQRSQHQGERGQTRSPGEGRQGEGRQGEGRQGEGRGGEHRPASQRHGEGRPHGQKPGQNAGHSPGQGQPKKGQPHRNRRRGRSGGGGHSDTAGLDKTLARQS